MSGENSRGVPLSYVIRKYMPSPKDIENRDVQIIYQASLVRNMFTRDSRKILYIIKEPTLRTNAETWIKGLKCGVIDHAVNDFSVNDGLVNDTLVNDIFVNDQ